MCDLQGCAYSLKARYIAEHGFKRDGEDGSSKATCQDIIDFFNFIDDAVKKFGFEFDKTIQYRDFCTPEMIVNPQKDFDDFELLEKFNVTLYNMFSDQIKPLTNIKNIDENSPMFPPELFVWNKNMENIKDFVKTQK